MKLEGGSKTSKELKICDSKQRKEILQGRVILVMEVFALLVLFLVLVLVVAVIVFVVVLALFL